MLYKIYNLSRYYIVNSKKHYVLKNVSFSLPNNGLVCIVGPSGCGKTTLLNLLAGLDQTKEGEIFYLNENILNYKQKQKTFYLNREIGFVFQNYCLLEEESAVYNVMLPALIKGDEAIYVREEAEELLTKVWFSNELMHTKCRDLSGGEKQRVAIIRAIINGPKVIFADEPTGALDSANSINVIKLLKNISRKKLVVIVTHDLSLVQDYADRIITLKDGRIIDDKTVNKTKDVLLNESEKTNKKINTKWIDKISQKNFNKRRHRNIFSVLALSISLLFTTLITGFMYRAENSIIEACYNQLDYGSGIVQKEINTFEDNSSVGLKRVTRPSKEEAQYLQSTYPDFVISLNYDILFSEANIKIGDEIYDDIQYTPIYSYDFRIFEHDLLVKGSYPTSNTLLEILINVSGYNYLKDKLDKDPLNNTFIVSSKYNHISVIDNKNVHDSFSFSQEVKIVGVVNEIEFLSTPKIYYSHLALEQFLKETPLNNYSKMNDVFYSWHDLINNCLDTDNVSSYSYRAYLVNKNQKPYLDNLFQESEKGLVVNFNSLLVKEALLNMISATSIGMELFLILSIAGTLLILGISTFSNYYDDRKNNAILLSLGVKQKDLINIHLGESVIIGLFSVAIGLVSALILSLPINYIIENLMGYEKMIQIPILSYLNVPLLFPFSLFVITLIMCLLITVVPIIFSKKISVKDELKSDD